MLVNGETTLTLKRSIPYKGINVKNVKRSSKNGPYARANHLVRKFENLGYADAINCRGYFVMCFESLPESVIWDLYENATSNPKIKSSIKYFIAACRNQIALHSR